MNKMDNLKVCTKCKINKSVNNYSKCKKGPDGLKAQCKDCVHQYNLKHRTQNSINKKEYRKNNKDKLKESDKKYYQNNQQIILEKKKTYYINNKESLLAAQKEYFNNNKEDISIYKKIYYLKNKTLIIRKTIIRNKKRRHNDINYRITCTIRGRMHQAIKNNQKAGSAISNLGCSLIDFKSYIEEKFEPKMSWKNYGYHGWHLDHIIPLSSFNLTDKEQFLKACHYTNYQPLWAEHNFKKGNKIL